jgi:hypothetical protein
MMEPHVVCEDLHGALMAIGNGQKQGAKQTLTAITHDSGNTMEICHPWNRVYAGTAEDRS